MKTSKRIAVIACSVAVLFVAAGPLLAGGYNLAGIGAKALAMGGAYRAIADDWSAMYWNPAGLAGQASGFGIEAKVLTPMTYLTPNAPSTTPGYDFYLYNNGVERSSKGGVYPAGALGLTYQFNEKMTAGLSLYAPSALGAQWEGLYSGPYVGYGNSLYPDLAWSSDMMVLDLHPTLGYQVTEKLAVGAGLSIKYAAVTLQSPAIVPAYADASTGLLNPMPYHHAFVDTELEGSGYGFGFNAGLLYDVTDDLALGLTYQHGTVVPVTGNLYQTLYLPQAVGAPDQTVSASPDAEAEFPMPMEIGFGVAYDISEKLTVAADLMYVDWSALDAVAIELDGPGLVDADADGMPDPATDEELFLDWSATVRYNFGLNYMYSDALDLRVGYYYDPTPIPDATLRPTITDVANKSSFSAGFAYDITENLLFEGYYLHLISGEKTAASSDNDGDGLYDNVPGDWRMQVNTFAIQIGYRF